MSSKYIFPSFKLTLGLPLPMKHMQIERPGNISEHRLLHLLKLMNCQNTIIMPRRDKQSVLKDGNSIQILHPNTFHYILPVLSIIINSFHIIQICVNPIHMLNRVINHDTIWIHNFVSNNCLSFGPVHSTTFQSWGRMSPFGEEHKTTCGVQGNCSRFAQVTLNQNIAEDEVV